MRLALHIFKKDTRRLWWETLVATGALVYLAHMDANRMDYLPGPMEGLMNLVVPAAWAYLIAMLVHQESLVGDRQFWLTRPYPRWSLLAAKLLFVLCFVHVPSFVFDVAVVQVRGFNALAHLPALLLKQMTLAAALTVPALALAAVTKNLAQFASIGFVCAVIGYFLASNSPSPWIQPDRVRQNGALLLITPGALAAVVLQYSRRRVRLARSVAIGTLSAAVLLAAYVPKRYTTEAACRGGPEIAITLSQHNHSSIYAFRNSSPTITTAAIPIAISGAPPGAMLVMPPFSFDLIGQGGERWFMPDVSLRGEHTKRPAVYPFVFVAEGEQLGWLVLRIDRSLIAAMSAQPVRAVGSFGGTISLLREAHVMPIGTFGRAIPGLGRCANFMVQNNMSMDREEMLKAVCESPEENPRARLELVHLPTGRRVRHNLGDAGAYTTYSTRTWLSPVHRRNTFFQITDRPVVREGERWLVMQSELADAKLEFSAVFEAGCSVVRIDFPNIELRKYILNTNR